VKSASQDIFVGGLTEGKVRFCMSKVLRTKKNPRTKS